jgi:ABC-type iron transport system FetAB ATPase subunit
VSILRIEDLAVRTIGPVQLLVDAGECATLTGASGAGKTLLLRAIADLDPHSGNVFCGEVESRTIAAPEWRRRVGLILAESQWWQDRVGDHLDPVAPSWFERLGFDQKVLQWSVSRLSTGERQRLALLRTLSRHPEVLLLDELTANLDRENTARVEGLVADYRRETNAAVLWVTHDPDQSRRVGSHHYRIEAEHVVSEPQS